MVFNSFTFLLLFLPLSLLGYALLSARNREWGLRWLLLVSLAFYAFWGWRFLPLLLLSLTGNYSETYNRASSTTPVNSSGGWTAGLTLTIPLDNRSMSVTEGRQ